MNALDPGRLRVDRIVERERTVKDSSSDLPAVGHLAKGSRIDGRWYLGRDRFDRGENCNARLAEPNMREQIDDILNNVALGIEVGKNIDRSVGDEQRFGVGRHVHNEDVAYSPRRTQAGVRGSNSPHEFVGMQAAFHQQFAPSRPDQLNRL